MRTFTILTGLVFGGAIAACTLSERDESMYLTGTEEEAVMRNGVATCENPKKALICHIPPGNPDNAHSICVSTHAVETHQTHHGDTVGACGGDGGGGDGGGGDGGGGGGGSDDPPPIPVIN